MNTQLHDIDVPFIPTADDMDAIYNGIGVTGFDDGTAIALTADRQDAKAAFLAHLRAQGDTTTAVDDLDIEMSIATFIRPDERDESAWLANFGGDDGPTTAVAWLKA